MLARLRTIADSVRRRGSGVGRRTRIRLGFLALASIMAVLLVRCDAHIGTGRFSADSIVSDAASSRTDEGGEPHVEWPVLVRLDAPDPWVRPLTEALTQALWGEGLLVVAGGSDDDPIDGHRILKVTLCSETWWTPLYSAGTTTVSFACGPWTSDFRAGGVPVLLGPDSPGFLATWSAGGRIDVHGEFFGLNTLPGWRRVQSNTLARMVAGKLAEAKRKLRTAHR